MNELRDYGRHILQDEAAAIRQLAEQLDERFDQLVTRIVNLPSHARVVLSGIGKTGFVAQKISATLAGVGIASIFLHPAEAVHGDLGRLSESDLVILLSNSGETSEVIRILPSIRKIGCTICSITGNPESLLAQNSAIVICLGKIPEAGPLGLAPTSSTTTMLALGDALAMSVLKHRPISREQFALYHPGGTLGRTLLLVNEIMRRGEELCIVRESMNTRDVIHQITLAKGRPGAAAVVDDSGKLSGIFTDGDMRRLLDKRIEFLDAPVGQFMGRSPKTVSANALAEEALKTMNTFQIDQVIVIDDQRCPVGLVDIQDLVMQVQGA